MFHSRVLTLPIVALMVVVCSSEGMEDLLKRSDVGGFVPTTFVARMSIHQDGNDSISEIELWRSGSNRTLVRLLDKRERGKFLLRLGSELWFISPGTRKAIALSRTHRVYGAVTIDVMLGLRLSDDYEVINTTSAENSENSENSFVAFDLEATSENTQFPLVRYVVNAETELPVSALYRMRSGRPATSVAFVEWSGTERNELYAKRIHVRDLLRKGSLTRIEVVEFEIRDVPEELFDLADPAARNALEATV